MRRAVAVALGAASVAALFLVRRPAFAQFAEDIDEAREQTFSMTTNRAQLNDALKDKNVKAMLLTIRWAEGTAGPNGYRTLFGGGLFDSFTDHPRRVVTATLGGKLIKSSAAGAYQILRKTWDGLKGPLALPDFSPASQDLAAVELIRRRGALQYVLDGDFKTAVSLIRKEWASMPGAGYGQPEKALAGLMAEYKKAGGIA